MRGRFGLVVLATSLSVSRSSKPVFDRPAQTERVQLISTAAQADPIAFGRR